MRKILFGFLLFAGTSAFAEEVPFPRSLGCIKVSEWSNDIHPSEWARIVRACVEADKPEQAMSAFLAYNSYILYDQQRVKDESAHVVKDELNAWIFAGYSRAQFDRLRPFAEELRTRQGPFYYATCHALQTLGAPAYRPGYMIIRGMIPRKSAEDWKVDTFDSDAAWHKAFVDINGCPTPGE